MDIIRSSVPSPFAVPVISKSLKPTASDLNEYLSLYVQRPIIPEPLRQSFNAGLGSLLLERQPNYMARPVIGPRAAIFPMNVGAPQAPYRSRLGALPTGVSVYDIAEDIQAIEKYASLMSNDEKEKLNSIRVDRGLKAYPFSTLSVMQQAAPPPPPPEMTPAELGMKLSAQWNAIIWPDMNGMRSQKYLEIVKFIGSKLTREDLKLIQMGDFRVVAEKIRKSIIDLLYFAAATNTGAEFPSDVDWRRFESDVTLNAIDSIAYGIVSETLIMAIQKKLTMGTVKAIDMNSKAALNSSAVDRMVAVAITNPQRAYWDAFAGMPPKVLSDINSAGEFVALVSVAGAFFFAELANQHIGFVPYADYSLAELQISQLDSQAQTLRMTIDSNALAIDDLKKQLNTSTAEAARIQGLLDEAIAAGADKDTLYATTKAALDEKIAALELANGQVVDVRGQLASAAEGLARVIAERDADYIQKSQLEAAGYVSKALVTEAELATQAVREQLARVQAGLTASQADHVRVQKELSDYKALVTKDYMLKTACKVATGATFGQRFKALFSRK